MQKHFLSTFILFAINEVEYENILNQACETTGDIEDKYGGDYDNHLTEKGKQQSKDLAEKLKEKGIQIIYHSPRIRATETAERIVGET